MLEKTVRDYSFWLPASSGSQHTGLPAIAGSSVTVISQHHAMNFGNWPQRQFGDAISDRHLEI
jgi:hypothetical protein